MPQVRPHAPEFTGAFGSLQRTYRRLPAPLRERLQPLALAATKAPGGPARERERWIRDIYTPFGRESQRQIMLGIARFAHINRPIDGYYFEFGSHEANTMRMAWDAFHHLFDWEFVAFDSFQGLPAISGIDEQDIWEEGKLATAEQEFVSCCLSHGIDPDRLSTVKGFYAESLDDATKTRFLPRKAAVLYVDCDLYESTVTVLEFAREFLQLGTVLVFDDWNCFHGRPDRGERAAFAEFRTRYPEIAFEPFVATAEAQSFICVDPPD